MITTRWVINTKNSRFLYHLHKHSLHQVLLALQVRLSLLFQEKRITLKVKRIRNLKEVDLKIPDNLVGVEIK